MTKSLKGSDPVVPGLAAEAETRQVMLTQQESDEDRVLNLSLRPQTLEEFIGQPELVENLRIAVQAARKREEPLEHLLFSGPQGLGKTTLAYIIAHEMGTKITSTSGPAIERAGDLIGILTNLAEGDVLFIDEIHRMSKVVEEFLYPAMEQFQIDFVIDKGPYAKTIKFNLKRFTLIGATTRSGLLTAPLRARFGLAHHLNFYETRDVVQILERSARLLGMEIDAEGAMAIADRARGTPRVANRLLRRVRDYSQVKGDGRVGKRVAEQALNAQGIDALGLDEVDRRVLDVILRHYNGGPVGIEALAATLNEELDTLVDVVEPYLLKAGLIRRTPRGREATMTAKEHLGVLPKSLL